MPRLPASFTVTTRPGDPLPGAGNCFTLTKTWHGGAEGTSEGVMLTAGDPAGGDAGYVASEIFEGTLDGQRGHLTLQQLGVMTGGEPALQYVIVPGSGTEELRDVQGTLTIGEIGDDGVHQVTFDLA